MKPTPVMAFAKIYAQRVRDRLAAQTTVSNSGCWEWTGHKDRDGYGRINVVADGRKRQTGAHRAAWIVHRGTIADAALQIDHLCRVRHCINPDHMELVTNRINTLRADHSGKKGRSGVRRGDSLHSCGVHGTQNGYLYVHPDGYTRWTCRACAAARYIRWQERRKFT